MPLIYPSQIKIDRLSGSGDTLQFRIHLLFHGSPKRESIFFDVSGSNLLSLLDALRDLQRIHNIPVPSTLRPSGRSKRGLIVVKSDDEKP